MSRQLLHHVVAVVCMMAMCFNALAAGSVVRCTASDGTSHLEWGCCGLVESDRCAGACGPGHAVGHGSGSGSPCEDEPVRGDVGTVAARSASSLVAFDLPDTSFAIVAFPVDPSPMSVLVQRVVVRAAAPPPARASIRTIIMLV